MLRASAIPFVSTLLPAVPCVSHQLYQNPKSPLFPRSLISTADDALAGLTLAPVPSFPFSGTIEVEKRTIAKDGTTVIHRLNSKVARDSKGRTRTEAYLNILSEPVNPKLVTIHLCDPVTRADIVLFPFARHAMHWLLKIELKNRNHEQEPGHPNRA